ncbi:MAG: hypothetical protein M3011_03255 [Actinomycetota bacterium]|nr:hypothetical protein [Actinomycetota bacterium]
MTPDATPGASEPGDWDGGWHSHRRAQLDARCGATPAQRLAWLEQAMDFARAAILAEKRTTFPRDAVSAADDEELFRAAEKRSLP